MALKNSVSILGCGWLGLPLGKALANAGYAVKGSSTTPDKLGLIKENRIKPYLLNLNEETTWSQFLPFLTSDILIISFPPGLRAGKSLQYLNQINTLLQFIKKSEVKKILFISSTSVYPDLNKIITEDEDLITNPAPNILREAEMKIQELSNRPVTIVRFSGLVGGTRHPGRFLAGKKQVPNPNAPVNLIHLEDCIRIISAILKEEKWGEVYNACADKHPTRKDFYIAAATTLALEPPQFLPPLPTDTFKIISNAKIKATLPYQFLYPNPLSFF